MFKKLMFILFVMPAGLIGCGNGSSNMVKNHDEEIILKPHLYYIEILKTNGYEEIFPDGFFMEGFTLKIKKAILLRIMAW